MKNLFPLIHSNKKKSFLAIKEKKRVLNAHAEHMPKIQVCFIFTPFESLVRNAYLVSMNDYCFSLLLLVLHDEQQQQQQKKQPT